MMRHSTSLLVAKVWVASRAIPLRVATRPGSLATRSILKGWKFHCRPAADSTAMGPVTSRSSTSSNTNTEVAYGFVRTVPSDGEQRRAGGAAALERAMRSGRFGEWKALPDFYL